MDRISKIKANPAKRIRDGLHTCGHGWNQFRVTVGTVFEHARIPLHKMLQAVHLLCSFRKGMCAHQLTALHRMKVPALSNVRPAKPDPCPSTF